MDFNLIYKIMTMKNNLGVTEQYIRIGIGAALLTYALYNRKLSATMGIYLLATAIAKYCPAKNRLSELKKKIDKHRFTKSEMYNVLVDGDEGSGGYRTGNPATGAAAQPEYEPM